MRSRPVLTGDGKHTHHTLPLQPAILDDTRNSGFTRDHTRRPPSGPPTTTHPPTTRWGRITERLVAAMAQGKRPAPFRTWKLRPGTAMILHPTGCGKVARRHTTTIRSPSRRTTRKGPPLIPAPSQQRKTTTNNTDNHKNNHTHNRPILRPHIHPAQKRTRYTSLCRAMTHIIFLRTMTC